MLELCLHLQMTMICFDFLWKFLPLSSDCLLYVYCFLPYPNSNRVSPPTTASKAGFSALVCTPFLHLAFLAARVYNVLVLVAWEMARFPEDGELEGGGFMLTTPQAHERLRECRGYQGSTEMPGSSWWL